MRPENSQRNSTWTRALLTLAIKKLHPDAIIPQYQTTGAVGFDFHAVEDQSVPPGSHALIRTGLVIGTPEGFMLGLLPRSSTFKRTRLVVANSMGVIDQDYCGNEDEIKVSVWNTSTNNTVVIKPGDRIAQGVFLRVGRFDFEEVESMDAQSRGGFGSTGV